MRPHPHLGLATVTYLYEGEIVHRDSVGSEQAKEDLRNGRFDKVFGDETDFSPMPE